MKKTFLLAAFLFFATIGFTQNDIILQHSETGLYLDHTVAPKESFYALGRLYNVAPKDIASFNGLDMTKGLNTGQAIRIPLNATNFTQKGTKGRAVYYVVGQKEGLYRVSVKNNNVQLADLRKWNKLANDNIAAGQKLIVGYLVSPEAAKINANPPAEQTMPKPTLDDVVEPKQEVPVREEPKKEEPKKEEPRQEPLREQPKKEEPKNITPQPKPVSNQLSVNDGKGGYFKSHFDQQLKAHPLKTDETASAGIFKTASGWQDAKYYALIDGVEPGTIIRIVNPTNSKAVYAKVLGQMSGIRQNQGYDVRISNAAATALEVSDTEKFIVRVNY